MNDFNINKDLVFFDIEATGLNVLKDRIIQIAIIKFCPGISVPEKKQWMINPGIPISADAMKVHGITPDMLRNKPSFEQVANEIYQFIGNADLAGYNSDRFDVPMLMEEFNRVGIDFNLKKRKTIDAQKIFYKMEPRTLKAALKFYCQRELENAHDAMADVEATVDVLKGQIRHYAQTDYVDADGNLIQKPIKNDMEALHQFTYDKRFLDTTQRLKYDSNGTIVFNFGKYIGQSVAQVLERDKQYSQWILNKDFSVQVKQIVKELMKKHERRN